MRSPPDRPGATCAECGAASAIVGGDAVYPHRPDLAAKRFHLCACGAYVGTHRGTDQALGSPAGPATRAARSDAHAHFDPLWREVGRLHPEGGSPRGRGYRWLAGRLGVDPATCHIGMMDAATARRVVGICAPELRRLGVAPERRGR